MGACQILLSFNFFIYLQPAPAFKPVETSLFSVLSECTFSAGGQRVNQVSN